MSGKREIRIFNSSSDFYEAGAQEFIRAANAAISDRGQFTVALSGGSTPKGLFYLLAGEKANQVPWDEIHFFWGDERHVPPDHPDSNYGMANQIMLSHVPIPAGNIHRIHAEDEADAAAIAYEREVANFFKLKPGELPALDLVLQGMGPDGHTASLFPGTSGLNETRRLVIANWVPKLNTYRITLTFPVLNHARYALFMVAGEDKASAVREVIEEKKDLPARRVEPEGRLVWLIDHSAAEKLSPAMQRASSAS